MTSVFLGAQIILMLLFYCGFIKAMAAGSALIHIAFVRPQSIEFQAFILVYLKQDG